MTGVRKTGNGFAIDFLNGSVHEVDAIVNAAGPSTVVSDGLPMALVEEGLVMADPWGGVRVDFETNLATVNWHGHRLYVLGHLSSGSYFGVGSIDAIQDQVSRMCGHLMKTVEGTDDRGYGRPVPARAVA